MSRLELLFPAPGRVFRASLAIAAVAGLMLCVAAGPSAAKSLMPCSALIPGHDVDQRRAVTLLFQPGPARSPEPLLAKDLERFEGFSTGLFSPTLGRYSPAQMMLDISQGARVASSLYRPAVLPSPGLIYWHDGLRAEIAGWDAVQRRANNTPGDIRPGALASAVRGAGKRVAWTAVEGTNTVTAIAAAAESAAGCVQIDRAQIDIAVDFESSVKRLQTGFDLVVATLPSGGYGLGIAERLAAASPERMFIIAQAPPDPARTRLLPIAIRGVGDKGGLTSGTTRRAGLVSATDIAPTILDRMGIDSPSSMQGQTIEPAKRLSPDELTEMSDRLSQIAGRRLPFGKGAVWMGLLLFVFVFAIGRLTGRREELARKMLRLIGLAVLWIPVMLLVTGAIGPSKSVELDIAVGGSIALALLTDRFVRWPRGPWVPVVAMLLVHGIDFAILNSELTGRSLLGSNPLYGARFFGIGNELEAVFAVSGLLGVGAYMCDRNGVTAARAFAIGGAVLALYLGIGRIGADVGGVVTVIAGFGIAALYAARMRLTALRIAGLVALPVIVLGLIAALDAVTGGESHLTRTVLKANSFGDLFDVADRRFRASIEGARTDGIWMLVIVSVVLLSWGWIARNRLLARLTGPGENPDARRSYRAALAGAMAATLVGALANDSGPAILIIGTIYMMMGLFYLRGRPLDDATAGRATSANP